MTRHFADRAAGLVQLRMYDGQTSLSLQGYADTTHLMPYKMATEITVDRMMTLSPRVMSVCVCVAKAKDGRKSKTTKNEL